MPSTYNRTAAIQYAYRYALTYNSAYPYYEGNDCTNFTSQCLQSGGYINDFHPTHPWYCIGNKTSICWAVAASLYWYIRICTKENEGGIMADTQSINGDGQYNRSISEKLQIGDIIQYRNNQNRIQHTAIITDFSMQNGIRMPLITQHTFGAVNIPWTKNFKETIFHHIKN